jgi:hypothetical protein
MPFDLPITLVLMFNTRHQRQSRQGSEHFVTLRARIQGLRISDSEPCRSHAGSGSGPPPSAMLVSRASALLSQPYSSTPGSIGRMPHQRWRRRERRAVLENTVESSGQQGFVVSGRKSEKGRTDMARLSPRRHCTVFAAVVVRSRETAG